MNNRPALIKKGSKEDIPSLLSLLAEVQGKLEAEGIAFDAPSLEQIESDIESGGVYVLKEGRNLIGVAAVGHDVGETFFPKSHSYRKGDDLLERIGYRGEPICILSYFAIDVSHQRMGYGHDLLNSLFARYKGSSWLFLIPQNNIHALLFFKNAGFSSLGLYPEIESGENDHFVVYRIYKKEGLCTNAWW